MRRRRQAERNGGFSLIEALAVILVMAILGTGIVDFISNTAESYTSTASRNQLSSSGRVLIDRIAVELQNSVPNSVRISTALATTSQYGYKNDQCIEFLPVVATTTYLNPVFQPAAARSTPFDVIDIVPSQVGVSGRRAIINPTSAAGLYKDSYTNTEVIFPVTVSDSDTTDGIQAITTATDYRFVSSSSNERLFITSQPVSFCVTGAKMYRYSGYGYHATQRIPYGPDGTSCQATCLPGTTPGRVLMFDMIDNSVLAGGPFDYLAATAFRNAVMQMELNFRKEGDVVRLNHEILQQAVP